MKGELDEAERLLHRALRLAQQADNRRAVIYTYSTVTSRGGEPWQPRTAAELQRCLSFPDGKRGLHAGAAGQRE